MYLIYYYKKFNTSYLSDSCIVFILKLESVSKNKIFGLKITEFVILDTFMK